MASPQKAREAQSMRRRARRPCAAWTLQKCAKSERIAHQPLGTVLADSTRIPSAGQEGRYAVAGRLGLARVAETRQQACHLVERGRILDGGRHGVVDSVRDLANRAAQDLAGPRLRQLSDNRGLLEERHRADPLAHQLAKLPDQLRLVPLHSGL